MANPENERRWKNRFLVFMGQIFGPLFLKMLYRPNKWVVEGAHYYEDALASGKSVIIASWHSTLLVPLMNLSYKGFYGIAGTHYPDAEIISRISNKLGWKVIRGSSTTGGRNAYERMVSILGAGGNLVAITPDGPQGPARIPKPGAIIAAQKTESLIIPVASLSTRHWKFHNWDVFYLEKPFGRIEVIYGKPLLFKIEDNYEDCVKRLTEALNNLEKKVIARVGKIAPD
ncbi:MAG: DUF374 domain-containing protein [Candidatus Neomarinimicrobiota bacterium]